MISLIIPSYRNPDYLDYMLDSCVKNKVDLDTKIIVVIDGFVNESTSVIEKYEKNVQVIELQDNVGMAKALNFGGYLAETEWLLIANDDQVMPSEWDRRLLESIKSIKRKMFENNYDDRLVITINQVEYDTSMYGFPVNASLGNAPKYFLYDQWIEYEKSISKKDEVTYDGEIFPFAIQKAHFMAVGGFDCDWYGKAAQCVDYDFFLRLELLDFKFFRTHALHMYHFGSVVTRKNEEAPRFRQLESEAHEIYKYKWGIPLYNGKNNSKIPPNISFRGFK